MGSQRHKHRNQSDAIQDVDPVSSMLRLGHWNKSKRENCVCLRWLCKEESGITRHCKGFDFDDKLMFFRQHHTLLGPVVGQATLQNVCVTGVQLCIDSWNSRGAAVEPDVKWWSIRRWVNGQWVVWQLDRSNVQAHVCGVSVVGSDLEVSKLRKAVSEDRLKMVLRPFMNRSVYYC